MKYIFVSSDDIINAPNASLRLFVVAWSN